MTIDAKIVNDRSEVEGNALDVEIEDVLPNPNVAGETYGHYPFTLNNPFGTEHPLSDAPEDVFMPVRGYLIWNNSIMTWFHELGHVLGLDDGYDRDATAKSHKLVRVPGHTEDMMVHQEFPISPQMITRIVRRSGKVDESKIKCPLTLDAGPTTLNLGIAALNNMHLHAYACDYDPPTDDPTRKKDIQFTGTFSYGGQYMTDPLIEVGPMVAAVGAVGPLTAPLGPIGVQLMELPHNPSGAISIPVSFVLPFSGPVSIVISPEITLSSELVDMTILQVTAQDGLSIFNGAFKVNGMETYDWYPGPPMWITLTRGAKECAQ